MYMLQRGQTFWFSRNLKEFAEQSLILKSGVQNIGKNGYLRFSLKTGNLRCAEKLARCNAEFTKCGGWPDHEMGSELRLGNLSQAMKKPLFGQSARLLDWTFD